MAGWTVGSVLLSWVLCSALNAVIEHRVVAGGMERRRGFRLMGLGLLLILAGMLLLCLQVYPHTAQAGMLFLSAEQATSPARAAALVSALFVAGYAGFQLRRYWTEE